MKKIWVSAIILLLGGGGIFLGLLHRQHSQPAKVYPVTHQSNTAAPPQAATYLVIKEWGVRLPLPASLQGDITYGIRKNVNLAVGDTAAPVYGEVAYFASKHLAALPAQPNTCALKSGAYDDLHQRSDPTSYDGGPGISVARTSSRLEPASDWDIPVASYWYRIEKGSTAGCYQGSDGTQEAQFIMNAQDALKKLEEVPPQ